jgi:hypothetical protein
VTYSRDENTPTGIGVFSRIQLGSMPAIMANSSGQAPLVLNMASAAMAIYVNNKANYVNI